MSRRPADATIAARNRGDGAALVTILTAAILCIVAAVLVSTDWWATFFAHPLVDASLTERGARLWRALLVVSAIALPAALVSTRALSPPAMLPGGASAAATGRTRLFLITGLIVIGLLVRCTRLTESLWYDEIASWRTYNGGTRGAGAVLGAFLDPINHTFHTLLNRWSVQWLVGQVGLEIAFRLSALLFSLAAIPVMFGLGRAVAGDRVGWIAATLAAIAPVCVLEGVEARGYAQMIFFSAAATWLLIEGLCKGRPLLWMLYACCCALGVWSQFVTAWIAIGHGAWLAWRLFRDTEHRARCAQGLIALALAGVLTITLHAPLLPGLLAWRPNFAAQSSDQPRILGPEGWHAILQLGGSWYWWAAMPGLMCVGIGIGSMLRRNQLASTHLISPAQTLGLAMLGLPLMLVVVALSGSWLYARFMLFALPGALLAMALGIDAIWSRRRVAGMVALLALGAASAMDLSIRPAKQPLRDAVEYVQSHRQEGDRVVVVSLAHDVLSIYGLDLNIVDSFMLGRDLQQKLDAVQPRWVIVEYPRRVAEDRHQLLLGRGYRAVERLPGWADWGNGDVLVMERVGSPGRDGG